jgi:hypothetical protein
MGRADALHLVYAASANSNRHGSWIFQVGAAVLGVAVKPTIKEVDSKGFVVKTLQRAALVEVQTPQVQITSAPHLCFRIATPRFTLWVGPNSVVAA